MCRFTTLTINIHVCVPVIDGDMHYIIIIAYRVMIDSEGWRASFFFAVGFSEERRIINSINIIYFNKRGRCKVKEIYHGRPCSEEDSIATESKRFTFMFRKNMDGE